MKIFVAGRWADRERIRQIMTDIEALGHTLTRDWTTLDAKAEAALRTCALLDFEGVRQADVFVLVADQEFQFRGAYAELGMAIALGKPVLVVGHCADKCIYVFHPLVKRVENLAALKECLL